MTKSNYTIADYGDFEIHISKADTSATAKKVTEVETKYRRKRQMIDKGLLSKQAAKKVNDDYNAELVKVYADYVIVGWKGKFKGVDLPEFNRENVIKFFSDKDKQIILIDITEVYIAKQMEEEAEAEEELDEAENKLAEEEEKN